MIKKDKIRKRKENMNQKELLFAIFMNEKNDE